MVGHLLLAISTFVVTNIDDLLILTLYFASGRLSAKSIYAGQYFGIAFLIIVSLTAIIFKILLPTACLALFGVLPIVLGVRELLSKNKREDDEQPKPPEGQSGFLSVATVTVANGG